jgi:hypothetical protein
LKETSKIWLYEKDFHRHFRSAGRRPQSPKSATAKPSRAPQDFLVVSLRKDDLLGLGLGLVNHHARDLMGFTQATLQLLAVFPKIERLLRLLQFPSLPGRRLRTPAPARADQTAWE